MLTASIAFLAGLALLLLGGELLVRAAVGVSERIGLSPLATGIFVVGFGTSTPELVASVAAALNGVPALAYANVVGSNISNGMLILGLVLLVQPLRMAGRRDPSVALAAIAGMAVLCITGVAYNGLGLASILILIVYLWLSYRLESTAEERVPELQPVISDQPQFQPPTVPLPTAAADRGAARTLAGGGVHTDVPDYTQPSPLKLVVLGIAGLGLLVAGGHYLVEGATTIARIFGLSETLIGLTIVAIGTSAPEAVTSLLAAFRGKGSMAFGNIVGSNIYNVLGIAGTTMLLAPVPVSRELLQSDLPLAVASGAALLLFAFIRRPFGRYTGIALLLGYAGYLTWRVMGAI